MRDQRAASRLGVYAVSAGTITAFSLPLAATPAQAAAAGHDVAASSFLATVFLVGIVLGELSAAALIAQIGTRAAVIGGLLLLGGPSLVIASTTDYAVWVGCGAVRGVGFAFVVIATAAVVAATARHGKLGAELGWYGLAVGIPSVIALPLGLQLGVTVGFPWVHLVAAIAALVVLPAALSLPPLGIAGRQVTTGRTPRVGLRHILRSPRAWSLAAALAVGATTNGLFVVYAPLGRDVGVATVGLLALALGSPLARGLAGRVGDRIGPTALLVPGLILCVAGLLIAAGTGGPVGFVAGAFASGIGFGIVQNTTLHALCLGRSPAELPSASALWNLAYDLGLAIGTFGFGLLGSILSPTVAAVVAASVLLVGIAIAVGGGHLRSSRRSVTPVSM